MVPPLTGRAVYAQTSRSTVTTSVSNAVEANHPSAGHDEDRAAELAQLAAAMTGRAWFVAVSRFVPGGPPPTERLLEHFKSQIALEKAGVLVAAGPLRDEAGKPAGGLTILRCDDRAEAARILERDPLYLSGTSDYTLYDWKVNEGRISITFDFSDGTVQLP